MKRQILIGIVLIGNSPRCLSDLSEDQQSGLLAEGFAKSFYRDSINFIMLTVKGRKIYLALEYVVAIGTEW